MTTPVAASIEPAKPAKPAVGRRSGRRGRTPGQRVRRTAVHVLMLAGLAIWLYPFIWMLATSFKTNVEYFGDPLGLAPEAFALDNYKRAWEVANFSQYFLNSLIVSTSVTLIVLVASCLTGYVLGRFSFPGRKLAIGLVVAAVFLPTGYTIIPVFQLIGAMGLNDSLLGVIVAQAGGTPSLFILLFAAYFSGIPQELHDAAEVDGAGFFRAFWTVFLPLAKPIIASVAILRFLWSWNDFFVPLIFTLQRPELRTLSVGLFSFVGENNTDTTGMVAAATMALVPLIIIFLFFQRYFIDAMAGAVKA
jgi:raffinose/stachyose/melibiose transport system permease protein